jgi:RNA polymerase sigma-70 factor (ECF subfamily)
VTVAVAERLTIADPVDLPAAPSRDEPGIQTLIEAARRGDREAFGDLVALHERVVFRAAMAALGRAEDAEDAAQEAFVVAWRRLPTFRGDSTFRTWLLTIVWRKALDRRRARRIWWTRSQAPAGQPGDDPVEALPASGATLEQSTLSRDLTRRIRAAIGRLSPKLKDTLLLAMTGEHSYDEIAAMLRVPLGTVKWRVAEARRVIKKRLEIQN